MDRKIEKIDKYTGPKTSHHRILVGNKCDFAESNGMKYIETSAKTGFNIEEAIYMLACEIVPEVIELDQNDIENKQLIEINRKIFETKPKSNMLKDI